MVKKKFRQIGLFDFTSFLVWTFLNFLAHSVSYDAIESGLTLDRNWYTFDVSSAVFRWEKMVEKKPIKHELMLQKSSIKMKLPSNHKSKASCELVSQDQTSKICEVIPKGNVTEVKLLVYFKDSSSRHPIAISKREARRYTYYLVLLCLLITNLHTVGQKVKKKSRQKIREIK